MERSEATGVTPVRDRGALPALDRTVKRRRRYSLEEKQAILKAAATPGATVSEVARVHGIGRSLIHNWRRQEAVAVLGATVRFTPVALAPDRTATPAAGTIEIELDGVRLRVDATVDEQALKRVLRALGR
jgi:transposase